MIELIVSSVQAIMQVIVIVFTGVILSKHGYIDSDKQKWLSTLNISFFTPCLLFSSIASVISLERLLAYWPIPAFYALYTLISWLLCQIASPLFKVDKYYRPFVSACVMFPNTNSLPVAIISSLAISEAGKSLYWNSDDNQSMVSARGLSYTLFFGLFSNILRWSYGYSLLQKNDEEKDGLDMDEEAVLSKSSHHHDYGTTSSSKSVVTVHNGWGISNLFKSINKWMTPPLYAVAFALLVGLCPPLKSLFYHSALNTAFTKAIESCGKVSVPIILLCLGAQLKSIRETPSTKNPKYRKPVCVALFIRMILTPLIVLPTVFAFATWGGAISKLAHDPIFIVSMVIVGCTPTAINLAQITQVSGMFEEEMLNLLFWSYGVACVPICTLVVFLALLMVGKP
ncbi:membrane transport protein-domain-containing protein [Gilbertella persicaria]|uniref:membrane transport protein-domain-containing protein n=1 Tax=Gilbertella persicaria TaxID=101096 RepID=UPI0022200C23|nr:membrane transport protein-domain-containing protein [Gilbertella persicaria]KAI8084214.1 membrane transport protein-domain-containing protein [Gilbertella persicaria]